MNHHYIESQVPFRAYYTLNLLYLHINSLTLLGKYEREKMIYSIFVMYDHVTNGHEQETHLHMCIFILSHL